MTDLGLRYKEKEGVSKYTTRLLSGSVLVSVVEPSKRKVTKCLHNPLQTGGSATLTTTEPLINRVVHFDTPSFSLYLKPKSVIRTT